MSFFCVTTTASIVPNIEQRLHPKLCLLFPLTFECIRLQLDIAEPEFHCLLNRSYFPIGNGPEFGTNYHSEEDRISAESSATEAEDDETEGPFVFRRQPNVQVPFDSEKRYYVP